MNPRFSACAVEAATDAFRQGASSVAFMILPAGKLAPNLTDSDNFPALPNRKHNQNRHLHTPQRCVFVGSSCNESGISSAIAERSPRPWCRCRKCGCARRNSVCPGVFWRYSSACRASCSLAYFQPRRVRTDRDFPGVPRQVSSRRLAETLSFHRCGSPAGMSLLFPSKGAR